jgi:nucleotide-binding universal stress UspA family protein
MLMLLHVVNVDRFTAGAEIGTSARNAMRKGLHLAERGGHALLERSHAAVASGFDAVQAKMVRGRPAEAITRTAVRQESDLVVVGSRGLTEFRPFLLGSVSRRVVMHAPCSVLVVKKRMTSFKQVIIGVDGSKDAQSAVDFILRLSPTEELRMMVVSVVPPLPIETSPASASLAALLEQVRRPMEENARKVAERTAEHIRAAGFEVTAMVAHGHIGHQIVDLAASAKADLVVVGSRGLTGTSRYLMGSVSDAVVKYAPCPVLVVRR